MARWEIQRGEAFTYCEDQHPVPLSRQPEHYQGEPPARREAINAGRRGYLCPGGEPHPYPVWVVYDAADEGRSNAGESHIYREAKALRDKLIAEGAS